MSQPHSPRISVCVLAARGEEHLRACLASLQTQEDPPPFELVIGTPSSRADRLARQFFPDARCDRMRAGPPGRRRNALVALARGELLLFLDDDVVARPDLLRRLGETAEHYPQISVFGGPNETPPASSTFQIVQGAALASLIGSGPVSRRYGPRRAAYADERWFTLCNLAVRRAAMVPFLHDLVCAEENAVLACLHARGEAMFYDPALEVYHARRPDWPSFAAQMHKYGRGRGQLLARQPRTARIAYLAPSSLLLYALVTLGLALAGCVPPVLVVPGLLYCLGVIAGATRVAFTLRAASVAPLAAGLLVTMHAAYGVGVLSGLLSSGRPWSGSRLRAAHRRWPLRPMTWRPSATERRP